jgi:hypothetical protein
VISNVLVALPWLHIVSLSVSFSYRHHLFQLSYTFVFHCGSIAFVDKGARRITRFVDFGENDRVQRADAHRTSHHLLLMDL